MADVEQVRAAVEDVVGRMSDVDDATRAKIPDRSLSCLVTDVDLAWAGRFQDGYLVDVAEIDPVQAGASAFRLRLDSDTLLDVVEGRLGFGTGWAHGRIRVDAGLRDVLALRRFL
jgi:hypothetical protein